MSSFGMRISVLGSVATVTAIAVILLASGTVRIETGEPWVSNLILGLILLATPLLVAVWDGKREPSEDSS